MSKINKKSWIHGKIGLLKNHSFIKAHEDNLTTVCGKTSRRFSDFAQPTLTLNLVTCPRCIEILKKENYYCEMHGFIFGVDVLNDGTCAIC